MADLSFLQQLVLAGVQGLVAAGVVVWAGSRYFREQERIRRDEEVHGDLAKLRQAAVVRTLDALGSFVAAKAQREVIDDVYPTDSESDLDEREKHSNSEHEARNAVDRTLAVHRFLIPPRIHDAVQTCAFSLDDVSAFSDSGTAALLKLGREIEPYLPELPLRHVAVSEYQPKPETAAAPTSGA